MIMATYIRVNVIPFNCKVFGVFKDGVTMYLMVQPNARNILTYIPQLHPYLLRANFAFENRGHSNS